MHPSPLILASRSPRRAELLKQLGLTFSVIEADVDESILPGEDPALYVERLAREKAKYVAAGSATDSIVIGGDTCIVFKHKVLGKPADRADAITTLSRLSGQCHDVLTAVAVCRNYQTRSKLVSTRVCFRELQPEEIAAYCDSDEPYDKAGSYAIQGYAAAFVRNINGSYSAVVGMPLCETLTLLKGTYVL